MKRVTKRELNQQTAKVLAQVTETEPVVITHRGVPRWRIEAIDGGTSDPVERLRAEGRIIPAKADPPPWPDDADDARYTPERVDALLAEMRGDR